MKIFFTIFLSCAGLLANQAPFNIYDPQGNSINNLTTSAMVIATTIPAPKTPIDWETVSYKEAPQNVWASYKFDVSNNWTLFNLVKFSKKNGTDTVLGYSVKSLLQTQIVDDVSTIVLEKNVVTLTSALAKQTIPVSLLNTFIFTPLTVLNGNPITSLDILSHYTGIYPTYINFQTVLNTFSPAIIPNKDYMLAGLKEPKLDFPISYTPLSSGTSQNLTLYFNKNIKQSGIITLMQQAS